MMKFYSNFCHTEPVEVDSFEKYTLTLNIPKQKWFALMNTKFCHRGTKNTEDFLHFFSVFFVPLWLFFFKPLADWYTFFHKFGITIILSFILISTLYAQTGDLFIIGGGKRPDSMINHLVKLSGGIKSHIIVIPNASGDPIDVAKYQINQFLEHGAGSAEYIYAKDEMVNADSIINKINNATCIFFSGGDQRKLTTDLLNSKLLNEIYKKWKNGCVISGTSAGAAVMSKLMITGDESKNESKYPFITIEPENIVLTTGFGFVKKAIIDQHFIKRNRQNRLISVILEHPELLGIGIDESTAIQLHENGVFEVVGENSVMIFDAYKSKDISIDSNNNYSASNIKIHLLTNGQRFDMKKRKVK